jgi:UDP-N-acetylglucosamine 2-epimerase (non-hydrolysing)
LASEVSCGIQEETTILGVPCITKRNNTERPITLEYGSNVLAGTDCHCIFNVFRLIVKEGNKVFLHPLLWDGKAAARILDCLELQLNKFARNPK